jgi:hypothetical protein
LWFSAAFRELTIREFGSRYVVLGYDPLSDQWVILDSLRTLGRAELSRDEMLADRAFIAEAASV